MKKHIMTWLKGVAMGIADIIPGVSGGTIAFLTNITEPMVKSLGSLDFTSFKMLCRGEFKALWRRVDGPFLFWMLFGVATSIFAFAAFTRNMLAEHPVQTWAFFFGLIIASAYLIFKDIEKWKIADVLVTLAGLVLGVVVCTLTPSQTPDSWWFIFLCGVVAASTMVLPGVSGSFMLVVMGKYEFILGAVTNLDWVPLGIFCLGCVVGLVGVSKLLDFLFAKWRKATILVLGGFILGSLVKVWPWYDMTKVAESQGLAVGSPAIEMHIPGAIIFAIIGAAVVIGLEILAGRTTNKN